MSCRKTELRHLWALGERLLKDLGVTISADWKVSEQCGIAARKGNQLLGMIKINIT